MMMRDTVPADEILSKASAVGQYYGFTPLSSISLKARGAAHPKGYPETLTGIRLDPVAESVASFLKQFQRIEPLPSPRQPLFVWHTNLAPGRPAQKKVTLQFHALGTDRAIADTVVIRAVQALARDLYRQEPVIRINSMGDKETRARYARELNVFFKKRANGLPEECTARAREDAFGAAEFAIANECADNLPAPTEHLSDASRKRFEDLLEYLETTETPYELGRHLISRGAVWNDICFELTVGGQRVAWGSRYSDLARHFFPSSSLHATGATLHINSSGPAVKPIAPVRTRFAFVHIGDEAKRLSIRLAEDFRKARIPLTQRIGIESLAEQLNIAERDNNPYLLIMGRKEALEGTAILRNRATQVETILPVSDLITRLKAVA